MIIISNSKLLFCFILLAFINVMLLQAQDTCNHNHVHEGHSHHNAFEFIENKNQFHENVAFVVPMGGMNRMFVEKNAFTYKFFEEEAFHAIHDIKLKGSPEDLKNHKVPGHSYKVSFKNSLEPNVYGQGKKSHYYNYFQGNDESKWASNVPIYNMITHEELYKDIDLVSYSEDVHFKYDFIVKKGGNPEDIILLYEGMDRLKIKGGNLLIYTSVGTSRESKPYAYQIINGKEKKVPCQYQLKGNEVTYHFPNGYDKDYDLVIDPQVIAATLSGTLGSENFGHTATFDNEGNIYAGGISFGAGYPTSLGAFDQTFGGGSLLVIDMVVSKYNTEGSGLIYATYIGGSGDDYSHSMIVDFNNQLCILGSTDSQNFPTLPNSFQNQIGGSVDMTVVKLNADGTGLVGSTYIGGTNTDGVNQSNLDVSYGERNRGEIVLDGQGNIYVASVSSSTNFPTSFNAFQSNLQDEQDGVVFKMNSDLSTLFWSTFLGGTDNDTAGGLRVDDEGNVVVVGTAGDGDFPIPPGGIQSTWPGGEESVYIAVLSPNGQQMLRGTFWGTTGNDHGYFVDIDEDKNIHIIGTTTGNGLPITPGTYNFNPGSPQFLLALNPQLNNIVYSTNIGLGNYSGDYDFVPIAFMVDKCNNIYFSGYYAKPGLPLTSDAISAVGNTFFLGVLEPDASALSFGSYYGNADHVDGGTSRFDKSGIIYQAVCSCEGSPDAVLNTLPNAWSEVQTERCDIGVFKIDFEKETVTAAFAATPNASGCVPYTVDFNYTGQDGENFEWQIEGVVIANSENTTYTFTETGSFDVMLIASAGNTCNVVDTSFLQVDILDGSSSNEILSFCPGEDFLFLDATTVNATYEWQDGYTGATYSASDPGIYWVDIKLPGCMQRDSFEVYVSPEINLELGNDVIICDDPIYTLNAFDANAAEYFWNTGENTSSIDANQSGQYWVTLTDQYGCSISDNVMLTFENTPVFSLSDSLICEGESVILSTGIPANYLWSDGSMNTSLEITEAGEYWLELDNGCVYSDTMTLAVSYDPITLDITGIACKSDCNGIIQASLLAGENLSDLNINWNIGGSDLFLENLCPGLYDLTITDENDCEFNYPIDLIEPDSITYDVEWTDVECAGDDNGVIEINNLQGGTPPFYFSWNGEPFIENNTLDGLAGGDYAVTISDENGCEYYEDIFIYEPFENMVDAGPNKTIELGDSVSLDASILSIVGQEIFWDEEQGIWCTSCIRPIATPVNTTTYKITVINPLTGCVIFDEVTVFVEKPRAVYIPNAFTPNTDGFNDNFTVFANQGVEQVNSLRIYDRWGELVFQEENFPPNDLSHGWNGEFNGKMMNPAVFVYVAEVAFKDDIVKLYKGDLTLVR